MTATATGVIDAVEFDALCEAIAKLCVGHPVITVRCALSALLAEIFAQVPLAHRTTELRYDLGLIRQYVRELPP